MKKHLLNLALSLIVLFSVFFIFFPYFTADYLDLRQIQENERILKEDLARQAREAEEKIYLTGHFDPALRADFVLVPSSYAIEQMKSFDIYLRKETFDAFAKMQEAAVADQIDLKIASATRNFDYQRELWNHQWSGFTSVDGKNLLKSLPDEEERFKKILEYVAVPSTSRHHWGTDIDINAANVAYFKTPNGQKEYKWLVENAYQFGFCQTYNLKGTARPVGYNEEKWHWTYVPLSRTFTQEYKRLIRDTDIIGFDGDQYVVGKDLIKNYVLSINPDCL